MNTYLKAGIAVALLCVGFVGGCSMKQHQMDKLKQDYAEQVDRALQENRELEKRLQADADAITVKYQKEKRNAEKTIADLRSRIASGDVRLSVRTESASGMPDSSSAESGEERAELAREDAEALVSIATDGDNAIRELNYCIDRYEALREGEKK